MNELKREAAGIKQSEKRKRKKMGAGGVAAIILILAALTLGYTFLEPHLTSVKVTQFRSSDVPEGFEGFKIVFISDIHHGPYFSRDRVKAVVNGINELKPDVVLLGGDYVQSDQKYIQPCFEELGKLKARLGVMGVLGNHDHWEGAELARQEMQKAKITLLDNTALWLDSGGDRIKIGGVGDLYEDSQDLAPTVEDVKREDFVLLVSHNPDFAEKLNTDRVDLMLSGHTHGGQVTLFGLWAPLIPSSYGQKYRTGLVDSPFTKVLVSNGIGTITPPVRFFARPQINVIYLHAS